MEIAITPRATLQAVELLERGVDGGRRVVAHVAGLPARIADRAFERFEKRLGWAKAAFEVVEHPQDCGPGFVLTAEVASASLTEIFTGFGERGVRAEGVADKTIDEVRHYLAGRAPVGEYLADQLLLPLALAGQGSMRTVGLTPHSLSNIEVIQQFLAVRFIAESAGNGGTVVRVERC
jgi:RNA 3'-terminal phosphate cyclase (ATP)